MDEAIGRLLCFDGLTVAVTGAATGIGESIARTFAEAGAAVLVVDLDGEGAERVATEIGGTPAGDAAPQGRQRRRKRQTTKDRADP